MGSTLEKLLSIQGVTEQQRMETIMDSLQGHQEREQGAGWVKPPLATENARKGYPVQREGVSPPAPAIKASPAMLEAWRMAFKTFSKYAEALRQAATLDDENEKAAEVFTAALAETVAIYQMGGDAEILAMHVNEMLEDVFKRAMKTGKAS